MPTIQKLVLGSLALTILALGILNWLRPDPAKLHQEVVSVIRPDGGLFLKYSPAAFAHRVRLADGREVRLWLSHAYQAGDLVKVNFVEYQRSRRLAVRWDFKCVWPCARE